MLKSLTQSAAREWHELAGGSRKLVKMHGLRNQPLGDRRRARRALSAVGIRAARICDLETGVGADQLIVAEPPSEAAASAGAAAFMRILNIDGWESEACDNALRCAARLQRCENGSRE